MAQGNEDNGEPRGNLDISTMQGRPGTGESTSTQTREGDAPKDGGDTTTEKGKTEGAGTGEGGTGAGGDGEGDALTPDKDGKVVHPESKEKVDPIVVATYYRDQFAASTRGAQDLLTKVSTAEGQTATERAAVATLTKEVADLKALAEGKNPDGLKAHEIQAKLDDTTKKLVILEENQALDAVERSNPLATGPMRESLKALMRANPTVAPQKLWDDHLKAGADAAKAADDARKKAQKDGAGEKGKGTSTRESAGGADTVKGLKGDTGKTLAEFNALPVMERRALMEKFDIRM